MQHNNFNREVERFMKETLSNMWFVLFILAGAAIQLLIIAIEVYKEERRMRRCQRNTALKE